MDGGAWSAAVHGVAKSRTQLSDFTFTFQFSFIGEGNGNPLQCSCLENPRDGGAWWAAVYGVAHDLSDLAAAARFMVLPFSLQTAEGVISTNSMSLTYMGRDVCKVLSSVQFSRSVVSDSL